MIALILIEVHGTVITCDRAALRSYGLSHQHNILKILFSSSKGLGIS